jgi:hypothetical protein
MRAGVVGDRLDPALQRQLPVDDALVDEVDAVLDAADAVGDLREVAQPSSFWSLKQNGQWSVETTARSLVRRPRHRFVVVRLVLAAQRRRADPLGALEPGRAELVLQRQVQVLRAGLGEHVAAEVAGRGDLFERPDAERCTM